MAPGGAFLFVRAAGGHRTTRRPVIEHVTLLVVVGALVVARIELAKAVRLLRQRDAAIHTTTTALATERARCRQLENSPAVLHRRVAADLTRTFI
jgi:hypothetical protein